MVEKSFYQLVGYDLTKNKSITTPIGANDYYKVNKDVSTVLEGFSNRQRNFKFEPELQQKLKKGFSSLFKNRLEPNLLISKNLGNIYTGSLYSLLLCVILNEENDLLVK